MKTHSILLVLTAVIAFSSPGMAQRRAGFYAGTNYSTIKLDPEESVSKVNRIVIGGFGSRQIANGVAYRYGLQFIGKGGKFESVDVDAKVNYLEMLFGIQIGASKEKGGLYLLGGAGLGLLASARGRVPSANVDVKELFQGGELSYHYGLGIRFKQLFVEGVFSESLLSVVKEDFTQEAFNKGFQLRAGLSFDLW